VILLIAESGKCSDFSFSFTVMLLEFAATPGSLQESFLKRKKNFIQKSLKRVEEIKNKERESEKLEVRQFQGGKSEKLSGQTESFFVSGRFTWGQDIAVDSLVVAGFCRGIDCTLVASLLLQTGIFFNLFSQGCGERFSHCLAASSVL